MRLDSRLAGIVAHGFDDQFAVHLGCDEFRKRYVEAYILVLAGFRGIDEFHRREVRGKGYREFARCQGELFFRRCFGGLTASLCRLCGGFLR